MSFRPEKIVLITGCSAGGIGYFLAEEFAARGCIVYATARSLHKMDTFQHPNIRKKVLDVTKDHDVLNVVNEIIGQEGRIDFLINNAGCICIGPAVEIDMKRAHEVFDINFFGTLRMSRTVMPHMAARKSGLIMNLGSVVAELPTPWNGLYCSSKAAVHNLTDILTMECKPFNIDVMLVNVSSVKSNISANQAPRVQLPEDSLYKNHLDNIIRRLNLSQTSSPMPTGDFAKALADKALQSRPPKKVTLGGNLFIYNLSKLLPRNVRLLLTWKWATART